MSETAEAGTARQIDPIEKLREFRNAYLDIWSKTLIETVNTEGYAQASGAAVDGYLNVVAPYKEAAEQAMLRTLEQLNMPSSADFAGLAGRFTNIEMQLDNMDAKLDRLEKLLTASQAVLSSRAAAESVPETPSARVAAESPTHTAKPEAASKTVAKTQSAPTTAETPERIAKPLRRNARKGTK